MMIRSVPVFFHHCLFLLHGLQYLTSGVIVGHRRSPKVTDVLPVVTSQPWTWEFGSFWPFLDSRRSESFPNPVVNGDKLKNLKIEQFDPFCFRINTFPVSKITVFFHSTAPPIPPYSENKVPSGYFKWSFVTNNQTRNWIAIWLCIKYEKIKYLQRRLSYISSI